MIGKQSIVFSILTHLHIDRVDIFDKPVSSLYNIISSKYFQFCKAHFLCNTIMPLFTNILNFQNDVYHFVTLLYKMTSHFVKMIIPGYFKTFYGAARSRVSSNFTFYTIQSPRYFKPYLSLIIHYLLIFYAKIFSQFTTFTLEFFQFYCQPFHFVEHSTLLSHCQN